MCGTAIAVTTKENTIKDTFGKDFQYYWILAFGFIHIQDRRKKDMIKRFQLNSTEKVILCSVDTATTYKLSDI